MPPRKQPPNVIAPPPPYTDDINYLAWSQCKYYPGTTQAAWDAYLRGRGERPQATYTRLQRATVARRYEGVLIVEGADGWQATNVCSVIEEAA